jgi:hypothetical protein
MLSMLEARTRHHSKLLQLKGKLDIMMKQASSRVDAESVTEMAESEALLSTFKTFKNIYIALK